MTSSRSGSFLRESLRGVSLVLGLVVAILVVAMLVAIAGTLVLS